MTMRTIHLFQLAILFCFVLSVPIQETFAQGLNIKYRARTTNGKQKPNTCIKQLKCSVTNKICLSKARKYHQQCITFVNALNARCVAHRRCRDRCRTMGRVGHNVRVQARCYAACTKKYKLNVSTCMAKFRKGTQQCHDRYRQKLHACTKYGIRTCKGLGRVDPRYGQCLRNVQHSHTKCRQAERPASPPLCLRLRNQYKHCKHSCERRFRSIFQQQKKKRCFQTCLIPFYRAGGKKYCKNVRAFSMTQCAMKRQDSTAKCRRKFSVIRCNYSKSRCSACQVR